MDRDGTLNPDLHYLKDAERLELYSGVAEGVRLARAHGFRVVCVTNQSGIGRGLYTTDDVDRIHRRLNEKLQAKGARIDAFYFCPHRPEDGCACRKPGTLLFERAIEELGIRPAGSAIVGDRALDLQAGERLGLLTTLVVPPGHDAEVDRELARERIAPDVRAATFLSAIRRVTVRG